jgi:hypothetical protein
VCVCVCVCVCVVFFFYLFIFLFQVGELAGIAVGSAVCITSILAG